MACFLVHSKSKDWKVIPLVFDFLALIIIYAFPCPYCLSTCSHHDNSYNNALWTIKNNQSAFSSVLLTDRGSFNKYFS